MHNEKQPYLFGTMQQNLKQKNTALNSSAFAAEAIAFFNGDGLHGKWTYSSPNFKDDVVNGAFLFTLFTRSPSYYVRRNEEALIAKKAETIISSVNLFDIFADMGCGGDAFANKIHPFLELVNADYAAIDINEDFIEKAFRHCHVLCPEKAVYKMNVDFMKDDIMLPALAFPAMLGCTITNFGTTASVRTILRQAKKLATNGNGSFIFSHDSNQNETALRDAYLHTLMKEHTLNVLYRMKRDLNTSNFVPKDFRCDGNWNEKKHTFTINIIPEKDMIFSIDDVEITLKKDQILPQAPLMKLSAEHMIDLAKIIGFNDVTSHYDDDKNIVLHQVSL